MLERLKEPSTYKGLTVMCGALAGLWNPALVEPIGLFCAALYGMIDVFRKENTN